MKKNHFKLFILSISLFLVACDKGEAYYHQWEGEYIAKRSVEGIYADGTTETYDDWRELPLYIFQDKGLYIQVYGIGEPYIPGVDTEDHVLRAKSPKRISMEQGEGDEVIEEDEPIELVWESIPVVVIRNGGVYTDYKDAVYSPKPIQVSKATSDKLQLVNSHSFEAIGTDVNGSVVDTFVCHWTYSPVQKQNEIYTWDAELHVVPKHISAQTIVPAIIRSHYVLTRGSAPHWLDE